MTAIVDVEDFLRQWRDTTLVERQAIEAGQWDTVAACQERKEDWMRNWPVGDFDFTTAPREIRNLMEEIVALERQNYDQLTVGLENTRQQLEAIGQSRQHLRQLRRAYGGERSPAWESWS